MRNKGRWWSTVFIYVATVWVVVGMAVQVGAQQPEGDRLALLERIAILEERLGEVREAAENANGAEPVEESEVTSSGSSAQNISPQELVDRLEALEQRLSALETQAVLSEPETRVRRMEIYVSDDGTVHDEPVEGARPSVTYQRERVFRRQTIGEKIEEALVADAESRVGVGVDAAFATQFTNRTAGNLVEGQAYGLSSADLFFTARIAQYTLFFADVVGLSGSPPDSEIPSLSLINGYTARLGNQNEILLREAWVRTEFFSQSLTLSAGRLDLTNYFDLNNVANDETSQFISDTLVNNPALGLSSNGAGVAAVLDPKAGISLRAGFQQSNPDAANLSESIYSLVEVGYVGTPIPTGEGNYRIWFRTDNSTGERATAVGVSLDQKLTPAATLFARFGWSEAPFEVGKDQFYSLGVGFQNALVFNRWDSWGVGYALSDLDAGDREHVGEFYYSLGLSDRLRLSAHLQYFSVSPAGGEMFGYLVPGVRFQAGF